MWAMVQDFPNIHLKNREFGWYFLWSFYLYFDFLAFFLVGKVLYFQKWYFSFHCPTGKSVHNEISPGVDGSDSGLLGFARQVADEVTEEMLVYATWFFWCIENCESRWLIIIYLWPYFLLTPWYFGNIFHAFLDFQPLFFPYTKLFKINDRLCRLDHRIKSPCGGPSESVEVFCWWGQEWMILEESSGQTIATSHDLTSKGSWGREIPLFQGNVGWCYNLPRIILHHWWYFAGRERF